MDVEPPSNSVGREIGERVIEAALAMVPMAGPALSVAFAAAVTASALRCRIPPYLDQGGACGAASGAPHAPPKRRRAHGERGEARNDISPPQAAPRFFCRGNGVSTQGGGFGGG